MAMLGRIVPDHRSHSAKVRKELVHVLYTLYTTELTDEGRRPGVGAVIRVRHHGGMALKEDCKRVALLIVVALSST
jgi:hypothetical protein